jgi:Domain of unknown function (DUF5916)/Carbohydrate family 9 binding domain-like
MGCRLVVALVLALGLNGPARAQDIVAYRIPDGQTLKMTGRLDDPLWNQAPAHGAFWQVKPVDGIAAPVRTAVRVLVDRQAIYIGFVADDAEPGSIRAPLVRRDNVLEDQDYVGVFIDPIGSARSAMFVRVNASGVLADGVYTADTDNLDFSPDFDVDARTQRRAGGYSVELRIPLDALRFAENNTRPWRVQVVRSRPRGVHHEFASVALPRSAGSRIELMNTLSGMEGVRRISTLSLRPSLTLRATKASVGNGPETRERHFEAGLDLSWRPAGHWVVDATLKPDFSQIELDVPQLTSNAQFPLQLQEKRRFFLESSDILEMPSLMGEQGGGGLKALYTRAITQPLWAARATFRDSDAESVLLALRDEGGAQVLIPGSYESSAVAQPRSALLLARYRRNRGSFSTGAVLAHRRYESGAGENSVAGGDGVWRSGAGDRVRGIALLSKTTALAGDDGRLHEGPSRNGGFVLVDWIRKADDWEPSLTLQQASAGYRNDIGFTSQSGFRQITAQLQRKNRLSGPWTEINPYLFVVDTVDANGGATISRQVAPGVWMTGPYNTELLFELHPHQTQRVKAGAALHAFDQVFFELRSNPAPWFNLLNIKATLGDFVDPAADRVSGGRSVLVDLRLRLADRVELEARREQTVLRLAGRPALNDRADNLLLIVHLSASDSLRTIAQRHAVTRTRRLPGDPPSAETHGLALSMTYAHRLSPSNIWFVGLSRGANHRTGAPDERSTELFAKWQFEL